jgi:hypothetical protein
MVNEKRAQIHDEEHQFEATEFVRSYYTCRSEAKNFNEVKKFFTYATKNETADEHG